MTRDTQALLYAMTILLAFYALLRWWPGKPKTTRTTSTYCCDDERCAKHPPAQTVDADQDSWGSE